jgi:hypothetical protein
MLKHSSKFLGNASECRVMPNGDRKSLRFRLDFPISQSIEFALDAKQAGTLLVALQAYQKKYRWPVPQIDISDTKH